MTWINEVSRTCVPIQRDSSVRLRSESLTFCGFANFEMLMYSKAMTAIEVFLFCSQYGALLIGKRITLKAIES